MEVASHDDPQVDLSSLRLDLLLGDSDRTVSLARDKPVSFAQRDEQLRMPFAEPSTSEERIIAAFREVSSGYSVDSLLADPIAATCFHHRCWSLGAPAASRELNAALLRLRKRGLLRRDPWTRVKRWTISDDVMFASQLALAVINVGRSNESRYRYDDLLIDQSLASLFETAARSIVPGYPTVVYILAALRFRKARRSVPPLDPRPFLWEQPDHGFSRVGLLEDVVTSQLPRTQGLYLLKSKVEAVYLGCANSIRATWNRVDRGGALDALYRIVDPQSLDTLALEIWPVANVGRYVLERRQQDQIAIHTPRFNPVVPTAA